MFKKYQRTNLAEMRELEENETKTILKQKGVSISEPDMELSEYDFSLGKIARNPENKADQWYVAKDYFDKNFVPVEAVVSGILADFENLLIDIMGSRKCSIGSLENYFDLHLEVKRINELYSKIQSVSQNSR